jgi:hypothetical protein
LAVLAAALRSFGVVRSFGVTVLRVATQIRREGGWGLVARREFPSENSNERAGSPLALAVGQQRFRLDEQVRCCGDSASFEIARGGASLEDTTMATYRISATQMKIVRDQRLPLANFEGALELSARFTLLNGASQNPVQFPDNGWITGKQGDILAINKDLGEIAASSASIKVEITELEPKGLAGDPDYGTATASLNLDGRSRIEQAVSITTSADAASERSATLEVTLVAIKL